MAAVGRPLPWGLREQIARRSAAGEPRRAIARALRLAKRTVDKYAPKKSAEQV